MLLANKRWGTPRPAAAILRLHRVTAIAEMAETTPTAAAGREHQDEEFEPRLHRIAGGPLLCQEKRDFSSHPSRGAQRR